MEVIVAYNEVPVLGQTPNPNFFGIHSGSIEIQIWGHSRVIDIQTLGGRGGQQNVWTKNILSFLFLFG